MRKSTDYAARYLLSVAALLNPDLLWRSSPTDASGRVREIRVTLAARCHGAGRAAEQWAARQGPGSEAQLLPFRQLVDLAQDLNLLLQMVTMPTLVPDRERHHRRWAEIEALVLRADQLVDAISEVIAAPPDPLGPEPPARRG